MNGDQFARNLIIGILLILGAVTVGTIIMSLAQ